MSTADGVRLQMALMAFAVVGRLLELVLYTHLKDAH